MQSIRAYFSSWYWKNGFSLYKAATAVLSAFGALWLLVEVVSFFSPQLTASIQDGWWIFFGGGLILALWINRPQTLVTCKLAGRDVRISICVGDVLKSEGAFVIGTNCTFDTDTSLIINSSSVQGQFTQKFYDSIAHLDSDLDGALAHIDAEELAERRAGKRRFFPIGTVARVRPKNRTAYFVAIAKLNENNVAEGDFDGLKTALPALWQHISVSGSMDPIVMPVLGTGFSRLTQTREEIVRELVTSFVAACAERRFTESLTIVIRGADLYEHQVDLAELGRFLRHICMYTQLGNAGVAGRGTSI